MRYVGEAAIPLVVSVAEFKRQVHLLDADIDDDAALEMHLGAAQAAVAKAVGRPLPAGDYEFEVPYNGWLRWWFPVRPVTALIAVSATDADGDYVAQDTASMRLVQGHDEPQLLLEEAFAAADMVRVQATAGDAAEDVPNEIRQAIVLLAKEWFDAAIAIGGEETMPATAMPVRRLIAQARYMRPRIWAWG